MKRVLLAVLAATAVAWLLPTGADAALNMTYQGFNFSHQGYDYAPSIVRDAAAGQWVMYECGVYTGSDGYSGDGIFRSTSGDGVNWSSPRIALTVGASGAWDDRHVCDPSVLQNVGGHRWAMWYTGIHGRGTASAGPNAVGVAFSDDGITWTRSSTPAVDCAALITPGQDAWGCGQPSVVWDAGASVYRMSHTEFLCTDAACRQNRLMVSADGIVWQDDRSAPPFVMPQLSVGPDFVRGADGWWYAVMGGNTDCGRHPGTLASELVVYRSPTMWADASAVTQVGCLGYSDMKLHKRSAGRYVAEQGFFRTGTGNQPLASPTSTTRVWLGFGLAFNQYHDPSEEIRGVVLNLG